MQRNSLSLCMIVRDAEDTVGRAIKSALAVVDEVVVVDTGSTDNTRLIVEGYGARVVDHPWSDDFAAARNAALSAAYGDWVLVLDADEVLETVRPVEVGRLLSNEEAMAYFVRIRDEAPGQASSSYDKVRLFRNHPDVRYRFPIHEQITPSLSTIAQREGRKFLPSPLCIVHNGGTDALDPGRRTRNQRLLLRAIEQYPDEAYFRYQLACETSVHLEDQLLPVKGFSTTLDHLRRAVQQVRTLDERRRVHLNYGADLFARAAAAEMAVGNLEAAATLAAEGIDRFGDGSLLRFTHGRALLGLSLSTVAGRESSDLRQAARELFEGMMVRGREIERAPIRDAYFGPYPRRYLGLAALADGDVDAARGHFRAALEADPDYTGALCGMAKVAAREGRARDALQIYLKALSVNEQEVDAWIGGAEVLLDLGFEDNARSWLEKLVNFLPEHPRANALLATLNRDEVSVEAVV